METSEPRTLIWLDTILCDAETDRAIIERYYHRFTRTITTIGQQILPEHVDFKFVVHLSRDKIDYLPRITKELERMAPDLARGSRVHVYDHPREGYRVPRHAHIDQIKNPNKQPGRRDRLFRDASASIDFAQYEAVVRLSMDDDDMYFPGHITQVFEASRELLAARPGQTSAAGFYRSYLVHVDDDSVTLNDVDFNKIIPGNKFFVIPEEDYARLESLSPWSLPETIDDETVERFATNSIHLALIRNNTATFAYMRRAQNLSGQSKEGYTDAVHSRSHYSGEIEFLKEVLSAPLPPRLAEIVDEPLPRVFRISCRKSATSPDQICVSTNFSRVFDSSCRIAFYLMRGGDRLDAQWYSSSDTAVFQSIHSDITIRAFVKRDGAIIHRASSKIRV